MATPKPTSSTFNRTPATGETPLQHCAGCKSTYCCNATCQRLGWKDHKPNYQPRIEQEDFDRFHSMGAIAGIFLRKDNRDIEAASHQNAIFYVQSFRPWTERKYSVAGPYKLSAAFLEAGRDLNDMWRTQYGRTQPDDVAKCFADMIEQGSPEQRMAPVMVQELRVPMIDKQMYYTRLVPEVNKKVAEVWRCAQTNKTSATAMYFVWTSEEDSGLAAFDNAGGIRWVQSSMSATEGRIKRTFTSLEAANACLGRTVGQWVVGATAGHSVHIQCTETEEKNVALVVDGKEGHTIKRVAGVTSGPQMDRKGVFINPK